MEHPVLISGSKLLKQVHVTELQVIPGIYMVGKTYQQTVLVEIIVHYLFSEIQHYLIVNRKR